VEEEEEEEDKLMGPKKQLGPWDAEQKQKPEKMQIMQTNGLGIRSFNFYLEHTSMNPL
jgi:hypothetical protein